MIRGIAERLDEWVTQTNLEAQAEGMRRLPPCHIRVLGQTALLEVGSGLSLLATSDVDVFADYEYPIKVEFKRHAKPNMFISFRGGLSDSRLQIPTPY